MQENEFEKKVQQRMEELRFRPSDAVWEHVEKELRRRRKRRVLIFAFLLAGLSLLGYSGYQFFYSENKNIADNIEQTSTPSTSDTLSTENKNLREKNNTHPNRPITEKTITDKTTDQPVAAEEKPLANEKKDNLIIGSETAPVEKEKKQSLASKTIDRPAARAKNELAKQKTNNPSVQKAVSSKRKSASEKVSKVNDEEVLVKNDRQSDLKKDNQEAVPVMDPLPDETIIAERTVRKETNTDAVRDSSQNFVPKTDSIALAADLPAKDSLQSEIASAIKSSSPSKKKLKWGIDFSIGMSETGRPVIADDGGAQKSMDAMLNPFPLTPSYAAYIPPMPPSSINPGFAFKIGPTLEWQLTHRSSVTFGLQYMYASTRTKIGEYKDTSVIINNFVTHNRSVDAVYRGYRKESYSNSFHFVQVPVSYQLQLNRGTKTPILWNAGISAGYLVGTNAVLYDTTAGGIYYEDKNAFNKVQLNLHTGFAIRFGVNRKMQWSIGPEFSMGASKLVKDAYNKKQYLFYSGLTGRLIFSKKK